MKKLPNQSGFSVIEVILAATLFVILASAATISIISGLNTNRLGSEVTVANQYNTEGMEAVRSIKNQSYTTLAAKGDAGNTGVVLSGGVWTFSGTGNTLPSDSRFNRVITVTCIQRNASGNIVGNIACSNINSDGNTRKVTATTTWNFNSARQNSVVLTEYLTNWRPKKGGLLVYGNGGTTTNAVSYQTYNANTDTWSAAASTASVGQSASSALRSVRIFASSTREEKVAISRHYNGTTQAIYAQVYNGSSWGNAIQLSLWSATTFLDVRNFDGTYLANGDFMVVYSDNTSIPKFAIWNGTSWTINIALVNLANNGSGIPLYIVLRTRPGTNEAMAVFTGQARDTNTEYFNNSSGYTTASWTLHSRHASTNPTNTKEMIDFNWFANNPLKGALIYSSASSDTRIDTKVFSANGSGGGSWSNAAQAPAQGILGAMNLDTRNGADEYIACDKDANNDILCFRSNATPSWSSPTNNTITTTTQTGVERSYDIEYESVSGATGIILYSDDTSTPKLKKYNAATNTFDASATPLTALSGILYGVRLVPQPEGNDILSLMFDANRRIYTAVWDGTNNIIYTSGAKSMTVHGTNGSATTEFWANFTWDKF